MRRAVVVALVSSSIVVTGHPAVGREEPPRSSEPEPSEAEGDAEPDDTIAKARAFFAKGIERVRRNEWGEALAAFNASAELRAHAVTTYNIGACYRATGRYAKARQSFLEALDRHVEHDELPPHLLEETRRFLVELDGVLGRVPVRVLPAAARVTVDGAPLRPEKVGRKTQLVGGVRAAGPGESIARGQGTMLLDPGAHVIVVSADGHEDAVVNRTVHPGDNPRLAITLEPKRAQLRVRASAAPARVILDGQLLGLAPLEVLRPAGSYELRVEADGREPYRSQVELESGKAHLVRADLPEKSTSVLESWWFWTAAGVVVTGAVVGTYFATRPEPTRPPLDGGGLGWTVPLE